MTHAAPLETRLHVAVMRRELDECREGLETLRECLAASGLLAGTTFLSQLHRRRFTAARLASGFLPERRIEDAVCVSGAALQLFLCGGPAAVRAAQATSRTVWSAAVEAWPMVRAHCPGHVYVCGGCSGHEEIRSLERFDPAQGVWESLPDCLEPRRGATSGFLMGKLFICGGRADGIQLQSVECFDPRTGVWERMPPMLAARDGASSVVVADRLYIFGGIHCVLPMNGPEPLGTAERFDPSIGRWGALPSMHENRGFSAAGFVFGSIYVCGGSAKVQRLSSVEQYDPESFRWHCVASMRERREAAAAACVAGRLYVCGGGSGTQAFSSVERYDPQSGVWELSQPMSVKRIGAVAAATAGRLYVLGGRDGHGERCLDLLECFDPWSGTWMTLSPMSVRRSRAAAAAGWTDFA